MAIRAIMADVYGADQSLKWFVWWRLFFLACAECFGFGAGEEWLVSHYVFAKKTTANGNELSADEKRPT